MPHTVRSHQRQTASGRTTTVRQHSRKGGGAKPDRSQRGIGGKLRSLLASRRARRQPDAESWWADEEVSRAEASERRQEARAQRRAEKTAKRARDAVEQDRWEHDMKFAAAKRGVPAYRPLGTKADDWKPRTPAEHEKAAASFREMLDDMREWRSRPEPEPKPAGPMTPQLAKALGCDTPEGFELYERGRAYREAGYDGPLDNDNRIPDPDSKSNLDALKALAAMRK